MKKRTLIIAITAMVIIAVLSVSTVFADICLISGCNCKVNCEYQGTSARYAASHKYGGVLGLLQSTCNYTYQDNYYALICTAGHITSCWTTRDEFGHTCPNK